MNFKRTVITLSVAAACAAISGTAAASGFALIEEGASGLGASYAGGAAIADDASTIFANPAGMSNLSGKQIAVTMNAIRPSAKFSNTASVAAAAQPLGDTGGDAGGLNWVPNAHFVMEINPKMRFGLSLNVPFGLKTEYDSTWMGRFQAIKSQIKTVNLNPSLSYQLNDVVAVGAGVSYQRIDGELSSAVNYGALVATPGLEGVSTVTGNDNSWGYNFGALFKLNPQTRVGLAYRSAVKYTLNGSVSFSNRPLALAGVFPDGAISLDIKMPDSFSASVFHQLNDQWDIMADATRTGWGVLQQLQVMRSNGTQLSLTPENWRNTWRVAVGGNYHYNEQWMARFGVAYDQTPTSDQYRTPRIPDGDRTWLSLGGQYKPGKDSALDFGYAHLFVNSASVNQTPTTPLPIYGTLAGTYSNSVDMLSAQYTHNF